MCRNIKTLFNFDPPATEQEMRDASLQFVRKLSGFTKPSQANEEVFNQAIEEVFNAARTLLQSLVTNVEPRDRDDVAAKARAKAIERFGKITITTNNDNISDQYKMANKLPQTT
jgi:hypothetical protein